MRVSQLNYGAIKNAYAAQFGARQAEIAVDDQRNYKDYAATAYGLSVAKATTDFVFDLAETGVRMWAAIDTEIQQNDAQEASLAWTRASLDIQGYINQHDADDTFMQYNEDGTITFSPEAQKEIDSIIDGYMNPDWHPDIQKQFRAGAGKFIAASASDMIDRDYQNQMAGRDTRFQQRLGDALTVGVANDDGYAAIDSVIDSATWLNEDSREALRYEWHHSQDVGTWNQAIAGYIERGDYKGGREYIKSLVASGKINAGSEEYNALQNNLASGFATEKARVATEAQNYATEALAGGTAPATVRKTIEAEAEARGYSAEFRESAMDGVDIAQIGHATNTISEPLADLYSGTMTAEDAKAFRKELQTGEYSVAFDGIEDQKEAYINAIDEYIKAAEENERGAKTSDINAFRNTLGGVLDAYNNGSMSFEIAKTTMLDLAAADGTLAAQIALESELGKLYKTEVPEIWKNSFDMGFDTIESFIDDMDIEPVEKVKLKNDLRAYGISWFAGRKGNTISQGDFDRLIDDMTLMANQEAFKALDHYEDERPATAIQFGINYQVADSTYKDNLDYILDPTTVSGVFTNRETGGYSFVDERTERMANDMVGIGYAMGAAAGISFDGGWDFIENANGDLLALPLFKSNILATAVGEDGQETTAITGMRYFTLGYDGLMEIAPDGEGGFTTVNPLVISTKEAFGGKNREITAKIENIEQLVRDTTVGLSEAQSGANAPYEYGISDEEGNAVDERMLTPEEQGLALRVKAYENEPVQYRFGNRSLREPAPEQPVTPASQDSGAIVETESNEPDTKVRIVNGSAQFWYDGSWYLIEETGANSEIQKAYEKYMQSFRGSIPRIRRN